MQLEVMRINIESIQMIYQQAGIKRYSNLRNNLLEHVRHT